jgi:hypothetical protein
MTAAEPQLNRFSAGGIQFLYPAGWELEEERGTSEWSITVRPDAQATAFWSVTLLTDRPDPDETVQTVLAAFSGDYDEIDVYSRAQSIARLPARGVDVEFVCLELTNSAFIRAVRTEQFTLLLLMQATDRELERWGTDLEALTASLSCPGALPVGLS